MPKVWLRCTAGPSSCRKNERIVTIVTAAGVPVAFFARGRDVIEDDHSAHVQVVFCGTRDDLVLVSVQLGDSLADTNFMLVRSADVVFSDTYDDAAMLPSRVTSLSRIEARENYRAARLRYRILREQTEAAGRDPKLLDEMWIALESAVDAFIRWEVIADEELKDANA